MAEEKRETGIVTRWLSGFGFIKPDADGEDLFVHHSEIKSVNGNCVLHPDQEVEFFVASDDNKKGKMKAINVTPPGGGTFDSSQTRRRRRNSSISNGGNGSAVECGGLGHRERSSTSMAEEKRERWSGVVKLYLVKKAYGFIKPHPVGDDLFFHRSDIQSIDGKSILHEGQEVEFIVDYDDEGNLKAFVVTPPGGGKFDSSQRRSRRTNKCYNCGGVGHTERICPSDCYTCGDPAGHLARECPRGKKQETRICHGCGNTGHIRRDCKEEAA